MLTRRSIRDAIDTVLSLRELGVRVYADGNTVRVAGPPELVTAGLRRTIARRNLDFLAALRGIEARSAEIETQKVRMLLLREIALHDHAEWKRAAERQSAEYDRFIRWGPAALKKDNP